MDENWGYPHGLETSMSQPSPMAKYGRVPSSGIPTRLYLKTRKVQNGAATQGGKAHKHTHTQSNHNFFLM